MPDDEIETVEAEYEDLDGQVAVEMRWILDDPPILGITVREFPLDIVVTRQAGDDDVLVQHLAVGREIAEEADDA